MSNIIVDKIKKGLILFLIISFMSLTVYTPVQAQLVPINRIGEVERIIYGEIMQDKDIQSRVKELELTLFNQRGQGTLVNRARAILEYVFMEKGKSSLVFLMNAMEWSLNKRIKTGPILERVSQMEKNLFDEISENKGLQARINRLSKAILADTEPPFSRVEVPADTEIKVELLDKISSTSAEVGDIYQFRILENILVDGVLVIPENIRGTLRVNKVEAEGPFGKNANIEMEILDLIAIDGSRTPVSFNIKEQEENAEARGLAVGVSLLAAVILNHPLGLVTGYFVQGEKQEIPENSRFVLRIDQDVSVNGIIIE